MSWRSLSGGWALLMGMFVPRVDKRTRWMDSTWWVRVGGSRLVRRKLKLFREVWNLLMVAVLVC